MLLNISKNQIPENLDFCKIFVPKYPQQSILFKLNCCVCVCVFVSPVYNKIIWE